MSAEFRISGRVVCIDDTDFGYLARDGAIVRGPGLYKGGVYTISDIRVSAEQALLALEELPVHIDGEAFYHRSTRFRPVCETSIDCFTALLAKPPVRLREDA